MFSYDKFICTQLAKNTQFDYDRSSAKTCSNSSREVVRRSNSEVVVNNGHMGVRFTGGSASSDLFAPGEGW